jgi:hypothetical protein
MLAAVASEFLGINAFLLNLEFPGTLHQSLNYFHSFTLSPSLKDSLTIVFPGVSIS